MHFEGTVTINAPRQKVWDFLTDPEAVAQCAPGLKSMEVVIPNQKFQAVVSVGFGSMKVTFDAEIEWGELDPLNRAAINAHATAPGSVVNVTSGMRLSDTEPDIPAGEEGSDKELSGFARFWAAVVSFFRKLFGRQPAAARPIPTEATELQWEADIDVAGRIKSTASRLMESVTNQLTKAFFDCVKKKIEG